MTITLFNLVLAYVFLAAVCVLALVRGKLHWLFKLALLVVVPIFYWLSYQSWHNAQGWPTRAEVPERFFLHAAVIDEPDPEAETQGSISIWVTDLKYHQMAAEPRAHVIDYNQKLHSNLQEAMSKIRSGKFQIGENKKVTNSTEKNRETKRLGLNDKKVIEFNDLPDPALPEK